MLPLRAEEVAPSELWGSLLLRAQRVNDAGRSAEAIGLAKRALSIARTFGPDDSRLATTFHMLGTAYRDGGNCGEARASFSRAVAIWLKQPAPPKPSVFNSVLNLLNGACECGDFDAAEKLFHTYGALLERTSSGGRDDARLAILKGALARGRKHYSEAEAYFREGLRIYESLPEPETRNIAQTEASLGVVIGKQGRAEEALEYEQKSLTALLEVAPHHPSTVAALNNVACALADLGRGPEAEKYFERALSLAAEQFGENNRTAARIMLNYSRVLREDKQTPAAESMRKRSGEAFRQSGLRDRQVVDIADLKLGLR